MIGERLGGRVRRSEYQIQSLEELDRKLNNFMTALQPQERKEKKKREDAGFT